MKSQILKSILLFSTILCPAFIIGQIQFLPYQALPTGSAAQVVKIIDLNNDNRDDIVLGTGKDSDPQNDFNLFVFYQTPDGTLSTPIKYRYSSFHSARPALDIADLNHDGLKDMAVGHGDSLSILFQTGSGQFSSPTRFHCGASVDGVRTADFNDDGWTDVAVSMWNEAYLTVLYQEVSGFSIAEYPKPSIGYDEIEVGDLNGDGRTDVVFMGGQATSGIHVFLQNSTGTFDPYISYFQPSGPFALHGIAVGDMNQDGLDDVVATRGGNTPNAKLVLWHQDPVTQTLQVPALQLPAYDIPEPVELADLNCDGKNEIIAVHGGWGTASVYEQTGNTFTGTYSKFLLPYASHYNPQGLSIGDINQDGKKDIAVADYNNGLILLMNNSVPSELDTLSILLETDTLSEMSTTIIDHFSTSSIDTLAGFIVNRIDYYTSRRQVLCMRE